MDICAAFDQYARKVDFKTMPIPENFVTGRKITNKCLWSIMANEVMIKLVLGFKG